MTLPNPFPADLFADGELMNEAKLNARLLVPLNQMLTNLKIGQVFCQATQYAAGQTLSAGNYTNLNNLTADFGGQYMSGNNFVAPVAGTYDLAAQVVFTGLSNRVVSMIMQNTTRLIGADGFINGSATVQSVAVPSFRVNLAAGDAITVSGYSLSTVTTYGTAGQFSFFRVQQVG